MTYPSGCDTCGRRKKRERRIAEQQATIERLKKEMGDLLTSVATYQRLLRDDPDDAPHYLNSRVRVADQALQEAGE